MNNKAHNRTTIVLLAMPDPCLDNVPRIFNVQAMVTVRIRLPQNRFSSAASKWVDNFKIGAYK